MKAVIIVHGVVQGVGYRFFVIEKAKRYNIKGYVRNLPDGNVQVIADGDEGMVNDFIKQLRIGPSTAHVTHLDVELNNEESDFTDFNVRL